MRQDARTNIAQSTAYLRVKAHVTTPASMLDAAPLVMRSIKLCKQLGESYKKNNFERIDLSSEGRLKVVVSCRLHEILQDFHKSLPLVDL
jgi:hypothetical protein